MTVWFMYDNHLFAQYRGAMEAAPLRAWITERFAEDISGSVFARDARDQSIGTHLHAAYTPERNVLRDADVEKFIAAIEEHANWEARG